MKQTRFYLGLVFLVQAVSCIFLVICYLFKGKRNTAGPFTLLGMISVIAGGVLVAEKVKEHFDDEAMIEAMNEICVEDNEPVSTPDIPVDDTACESEFN